MTTKLVNGVSVDMDPAEAAAFEADRTPTLPQAKKLMRDRIAARRVVAEQGGFLHLTVRYNSDPQMLARIAIVAERARTAKTTATAFSINVIAADDTSGPMSADAYIALEKSAGDHFLACSDNAKTLRQAVNACTDVPSALAVNIEVGWP